MAFNHHSGVVDYVHNACPVSQLGRDSTPVPLCFIRQ